MITKQLLQKIIADYRLSLTGIHGIAHWARVLENGRMLVEHASPTVSKSVVELFAVFHDSCRKNDMRDKNHGRRGADYAASLRGTYFELPDSEFDLLYEACCYHNLDKKAADETVQICWDSDRLDLARVFIKPDPKYLFTLKGKRPDTIVWANRRSTSNFKPKLIRTEWELKIKINDGLLGSFFNGLKKIIIK